VLVTGLDHVQLAMPPRGEEEARAFYGGLLGLTEVEKPPALRVRGGCWFQAPGIQIHLGVQPDFEPARKAHPGLLVADLQAARAALEGAGIPVQEDDAEIGRPRFHASDPFGNRLEFMTATGAAS